MLRTNQNYPWIGLPRVITIQSNLAYLDTLGLDEIVWIIKSWDYKNMNINEAQNYLTVFRTLMSCILPEHFGKGYGLRLHFVTSP